MLAILSIAKAYPLKYNTNMNKLSLSKHAQIIGMLVEGNSLRSTSRMADVAYNTVLKLLVEVGEVCGKYQYINLKNLPCKRIQVDEIWSFNYCKQKNVDKLKQSNREAGNVWTWVAICEDTKLVPCWLVGDREIRSAKMFMDDLASRMAERIQLTSDGYKAYETVVDSTFAGNVDYAMLKKIYSASNRYIGADRQVMNGNPDKTKISTSYIERQNLTMRMSMRRFTRKTNGFSKKLQNHTCAIALHFMWYNYGRIHKTLKVTPAMEAGITDHIWTLQEIVGLISK